MPKPQQILPNGLADTNDPINSWIQKVQPGLRIEVAQVADDASVSNQFDVHAHGRPETIHRRSFVEHVQNVVRLAFQLVPNEPNAGSADFPFENVRNCRYAGCDQGIIIKRPWPGDDGDVDTAFVHFDERAGLRGIALSIDAKNCQRLAHRYKYAG